MTGKSKSVCLWFYKHTDVLNTVSPDPVKFELSKELNLIIKELQPGFINEDDSIWDVRGNESKRLKSIFSNFVSTSKFVLK